MDFDTLWRNIVKRLTDEYAGDAGNEFVLPTSKAAALDYLDNLKRRVEVMEDVKAFPEGDPGMVLFALLWDRAGEVSDREEFGHDCKGYTRLIELFEQIATREDPWSVPPPPR
jgi:hypothetical protein